MHCPCTVHALSMHSDLVKRAEKSAKYGAHILGKDGNGLPCKTAAIVLDKRHVATHAHADHSGLKLDQEVEVS